VSTLGRAFHRLEVNSLDHGTHQRDAGTGKTKSNLIAHSQRPKRRISRPPRPGPGKPSGRLEAAHCRWLVPLFAGLRLRAVELYFLAIRQDLWSLLSMEWLDGVKFQIKSLNM